MRFFLFTIVLLTSVPTQASTPSHAERCAVQKAFAQTVTLLHRTGVPLSDAKSYADEVRLHPTIEAFYSLSASIPAESPNVAAKTVGDMVYIACMSEKK
jgi:hypothetical protein